MNRRWVIGLACGSTADGTDAVLLELQGVGLGLAARCLHSLHQPYPRELRDLLRKVGHSPPEELRQLALLHRILGEVFAAAARLVADRASFSLQEVQCLGCPGQTVWHDPEGRYPSTLALGMAAVVAERTGITTVSDFRSRDLALGGQGAPLTAVADYLLFSHPTETRVLVHLGGNARIVYLPAGAGPEATRGFEAGPCNALLDGLMRQLTGGREQFDNGGKHAVQGRCLGWLLERWLAHPDLQRRPPKCLPRQGFGEDFALRLVETARRERLALHDLLCTATHFVARCITTALRQFLPELPRPSRVLLSGGGVRNGLLWHLLEKQLPGLPLERTDAHGLAAEAREAAGCGMLAALTVDGVMANLPSVTGASGSRLLGSVTPGSSSNWARCLDWMATQLAPLAVNVD